MTDTPKWRRRAEARPQEIAAAAFAVFANRGYAAARLTDIAARAGVSKAALYLYFPTKADLFTAVLLQNLSPRVGAVANIAGAEPPSLATIERLLAAVAETLSAPTVGKLARIVIAESGNFPEIARAWREAVVAPALAALQQAIEGGQRAGSLRDGDAGLMAMTVVGPLLLGAIWREVIEPVGGEPLDMGALTKEHALTLTQGLARGHRSGGTAAGGEAQTSGPAPSKTCTPRAKSGWPSADAFGA